MKSGPPAKAWAYFELDRSFSAESSSPFTGNSREGSTFSQARYRASQKAGIRSGSETKRRGPRLRCLEKKALKDRNGPASKSCMGMPKSRMNGSILWRLIDDD